MSLGFKEIKKRVISALRAGNYQHEARADINIKNLLVTGQVSPKDVEKILGNCTNNHLSTTPHHEDSSIAVHVVKKDDWYIKFYFIDPQTIFISVHQ